MVAKADNGRAAIVPFAAQRTILVVIARGAIVALRPAEAGGRTQRRLSGRITRRTGLTVRLVALFAAGARLRPFTRWLRALCLPIARALQLFLTGMGFTRVGGDNRCGFQGANRLSHTVSPGSTVAACTAWHTAFAATCAGFTARFAGLAQWLLRVAGRRGRVSPRLTSLAPGSAPALSGRWPLATATAPAFSGL